MSKQTQDCGCTGRSGILSHKVVTLLPAKKITQTIFNNICETLNMSSSHLQSVLTLSSYKNSGVVLYKGSLEECNSIAQLLGQKGIISSVENDRSYSKTPSIIK